MTRRLSDAEYKLLDLARDAHERGEWLDGELMLELCRGLTWHGLLHRFDGYYFQISGYGLYVLGQHYARIGRQQLAEWNAKVKVWNDSMRREREG